MPGQAWPSMAHHPDLHNTGRWRILTGHGNHYPDGSRNMIRHMITHLAAQGYAHALADGDGWLWVHAFATRTGEWV